ncbi:hypothetical protein SD70_09180 [Gordoniibacillus kamchatkensis]|uniref:DUF2512 family protein n=1 Tax=Gordoniibacillus kamchatkensis TaxID=1590651 RepID=A0ABR5AJJ2_9BACL|nr:DUF2512 family protein [Paenibacillus sp. VKM B-2647]KIL41184.1 hypothetical protein SD70_09180 [Paenibacillus sp. VKM B-2647]
MWRKLFWKALWNGIVTVPLLLWFSPETSVTGALVASLALTVVSYIVGDQMILRSTNNVIATVCDALLAFFFVWVTAYYAKWTLSFTELCVIGIGAGVVEYFYHRYLASERAAH